MQCVDAVLSNVACPAPQVISQKELFLFGGGELLGIQCFYFLYNFCLKHFSFTEEMS